MLKRVALTGMLLATLAVAPLTIAAQDWNHGYRAANTAPAINRRMQPRTVLVDPGNRGPLRVEFGDREQRGREMVNRHDNRDLRAYGEHNEWNR